MFTRSLVMIVCATAIAVGMLSLRQHRLAMMNEMTRLHRRMNASRQGMWDVQMRIADRLGPPRLIEAMDRAQLRLEPVTPGVAEARQREANESPIVQVQGD